MRLASVDTLSPPAILPALPTTIEQRPHRLSAAVWLLPLCLVLSLMAIPFVLLVAHAADEGSVRAALLERPAAVIQLGLGLVMWTALFAWPAWRLIDKVVSSRTVTFGPGVVTVNDRGALGTSEWTVPVSEFDGLAHHVRASMSGTRHELILVHPDRSRSVLVAMAPRIGQSEIERVCHLLQVGEVPARQLYTADGVRLAEPVWPAAPVAAPALRAAA